MDLDERVLDDIPGVIRVADDAQGDGVGPAMVPLVELPERVVITLATSRDELTVVMVLTL